MMYQMPGDNGEPPGPAAPADGLLPALLRPDLRAELRRQFSSAVNDPAVIGVQADVYQFMQFTGVLASLQLRARNPRWRAASAVPEGGTSTAPTSLTSGGISMMIPAMSCSGTRSSR